MRTWSAQEGETCPGSVAGAGRPAARFALRGADDGPDPALGDRLRSVEDRVTGRNVLIAAKPSRFWQKRGIRRTLESLPALDGYRARIDVTVEISDLHHLEKVMKALKSVNGVIDVERAGRPA